MSHDQSPPEPTDFTQPPTGQPYLRASSADRDATLAIIDQGLDEGRLTKSEHAERSERAERARTLSELNVLTSDLVVVQDTHHADDVVPHAMAGAAVPHSYAKNSIEAYFSTKPRQGVWIVPPHLNVRTALGEVKLDMREAVFESLEVVIDVSEFMSEVKLWVPRGVTVIDETHGVLSSVSMKKMGPPLPGMPRIVLTGSLVMSSLNVRGSHQVTLADRINGNF